MRKTKIEWCDATVNPVVGCTFGCPYCYAKRMNDRFGFVEDFTKPQFFPERLKQLNSKKPKIVFMDSMSDVADWESDWKHKVFNAMLLNSQHTYLFLTKRPKAFLFPHLNNIWMGVSVTNFKEGQKGPFNGSISPSNFLSIEPLLGSFDSENILDFFQGVHWVIIGAETGNRKEKITPPKAWVDNIVQACKRLGIPIFMKESLRGIIGLDMLHQVPSEIIERRTK